MRKYASEYVDVEVDIEFDDIVEYIEDYATSEERKEIKDIIGGTSNSTLYDDDKRDLLEQTFNKFSLEEIQDILQWKPGEGITIKPETRKK